MPSAFEHGPTLTVVASPTANAGVIWSAANNLGQSTVLLGTGTLGISGDTDIITLTADTVTVAGTVAATTLTGNGAGVTALAAANITANGTLPALNGAALTALNASNLGSGTVPVARLGDGNESNSTFLRGDNTWVAVSGTTINNNADNLIITGSSSANTLEAEANLTYDGSELTVGGTSAKLVLDQSSGDGYIFELRSSDVAHGLSGYNTATYGQFMKKHADSGMLQIWGFSDANANQAIGLSLVGVSGIAANTTKTSAAIGIVEILGGIKGNGNISNPASNGNILVVRDAASGDAKMIVDMEGDVRVKENSSMPSVTKGAAKAWLSYDYGGGTPTAYASYNVASLGDDGTGHVQMNFTTAMESVHYSIVGMPSATRATMNASTLLTGSADFKIWHSNDTLADIDGGIAIFGEAT